MTAEMAERDGEGVELGRREANLEAERVEIREV